MLQIGCDEVRVSSLLPINLLKASGRLESLKSVAYCVGAKHYLGPTHEEPVVQIFKDIFNGTGKDESLLPQHLLQFQTKFRNEKRARTGLLRCREFLMQDSYSFHASAKCLNETFFKVAKCYRDIFHCLGLKFVEVRASSGIMGGADSIEFQLISDRGEDKLLRNQSGDTFNAEIAPCYRYAPSQNSDFHSFQNIEIDEDLTKVAIDDYQGAKVLTLSKADGRGSFNYLKLFDPTPGAYYVDFKVAALGKFRCSYGVGNWRSLQDKIHLMDLSYAKEGSRALDGSTYTMARGIEIAHIFKLGTRYSEPMGLKLKCGKAVLMGSYGIGISRLFACCAMQNSKRNRLTLPKVLVKHPIAIICNKNEGILKPLRDACDQEKLSVQIYFTGSGKSIKDQFDALYLKGISCVIILRNRKISAFDLDKDEEISLSRDLDQIIAYLKGKES